MNPISIFDIFKIGVGPSSSHTLGPWKAAGEFAKDLAGKKVSKINVILYGSLSKTGRGHATDIAVQLGLEGHNPELIDTSKIEYYIEKIKSSSQIEINGTAVPFNPKIHIEFNNTDIKDHPNTLELFAYNENRLLKRETYFSIGGGFIVRDGQKPNDEIPIKLPFPINKAEELLLYTTDSNKRISDIVFQNELKFRTETEIKDKIQSIFETMENCVFRGCSTDGILPCGLHVKRRAKSLCENLLKENMPDTLEKWQKKIRECSKDFNSINKWISCFAIAVNEENAALGRIVTSPTNGAAGVIPAVLLYYYLLCENNGMEDIKRFLMVSGEIGCMFKKGATISAAVGGCQAEIGVSSAMAAGGLTEVLGGTPEQV